MKLKEIKCILNSEKVEIYTDVPLVFETQEGGYFLDDGENEREMFEIFGDFEIRQMYCYDEAIVIELEEFRE